ncbi:MAG: hypothetical protein RR505_08260 [Raoultibacter sp.]
MNNMEKLTVLTALEKAVKDEIKEIRIEANVEIMEANEKSGVEKLGLKLGDTKVGEFIVTYNSDGFAVINKELFEEFALEYGLASKSLRINPSMEQSAIKFLESSLDPEVEERITVSSDWEKAMERGNDCVLYMDSGMIVPGVEYRPKTIKGTMIRGCKPSDVLPILRNMPGGIDAALLGDGNE